MRTFRPRFNWDHLKEVKCPKEGTNLERTGAGYKCVYGDCGYFITHKRFDEIVADLYRPKARRCAFAAPEPQDNGSELNNLETGARRSAFEDMPTRGDD